MKSVFISWDIDGTLILGTQSTIDHFEAFKRACEELYGPCDVPEKFLGHCVDGWMDKRILKAIIAKQGAEVTEENVERAMTKMQDIFCQISKASSEVPPGVFDALEVLSKMPNVTMGIASGNLPRIAWHKLELAGVAKYFPQRIGGLGVYQLRQEAVLAAKQMAEEKVGHGFDIHIHVGDTSNDSEAARAVGAISVCVRTGRVKYAEYGPDAYVFDSFAQPGALEKLKELVQ